MRAVTRLCSYTSKQLAKIFYTWLPLALRITILSVFVVLNRCGRAYARHQYKAMIKKKGLKFVYGRRKNIYSFFSRSLKSMSQVQTPLECVICLSEFVEGEVGRELEECKHKFHANCVEEWLMYGELGHASCPLCRSAVVVPAEIDDVVGEQWKYGRGERLCFEEDLALLLLRGVPKNCLYT